MPSFICLAWPADDEVAARAAIDRAAVLRADRWRLRLSGPGLSLWTRGRELAAHELDGGRGFVLGELYAPPADRAFSLRGLLRGLPSNPRAAAERLVGSTWGRYVAVLAAPDGRPSVFRDPSGMLEAFTWRLRDGVDVVSDGVSGLPFGLAPPRLALDWTRLARSLAEPVAGIVEPPLTGFATVGAGELCPLDGAARPQAIWRPTPFARPLELDAAGAAQALLERLDHCTAALLAPHPRVLGEISGGFDSAAVAAAAAATGHAERADWINVYADFRGSDERAYARAAAAALGLPLTEAKLSPAPLAEDDFEGVLEGVRPPLTAASREYDREIARRARETGASALLTGEGGDAVLFQMPSPLVFADHLRARGWRAALSPELAQHARWTRRPVWALLSEAARTLGRPAPPQPSRIPLPGARPLTGPPWRHPWMADADGLPPGKRLQLAAIANAQVHTADSRRRQVVQLINPLLAQPVVELCLGLPTPLLTLGGRDRGLARHASTGRLPAQVATRRSKGDMALFYGQVVTANLDWLRNHLLGGCLAEAGVFDAEVLAQALTPEVLAYRGGASAILAAAMTETWVRHWQRRIPDSTTAPRDCPVEVPMPLLAPTV